MIQQLTEQSIKSISPLVFRPEYLSNNVVEREPTKQEKAIIRDYGRFKSFFVDTPLVILSNVGFFSFLFLSIVCTVRFIYILTQMSVNFTEVVCLLLSAFCLGILITFFIKFSMK